jgi:hypothetical protein
MLALALALGAGIVINWQFVILVDIVLVLVRRILTHGVFGI